MLVDASGQPLRSTAPASPPAPTDTADDAQAREKAEAAAEIAAVRQRLRNTLGELMAMHRQGAVAVEMSIGDAGGLVQLAASSLDKWLDDRAFDSNGVKQPSPGSMAKHWEQHIASLIAWNVQQIKAAESTPAITLVPADALNALPRDAQAAMTTALARG
jgi:hypothetical protein